MLSTVLERLLLVVDPLVQFRLQLMVALLLVAAGLLFYRRWLAATLSFAVAFPTLLGVLAFYLPASTPTHSPVVTESPKYRLLLFNLRTQNDQVALVQRLVEEVEPDVICFVEADGPWRRHLKKLDDKYPHRSTDAKDWGHDVKIFSRFPLTLQPLVSEDYMPLVIVSVEAPGATFTVAGAHPLSPISLERVRLRNRQLATIGGFVENLEGPLLIAGDFNCTTWSCHLQGLMKQTGLRDSRQGFGIQATWPSWPNCFPIRIPIDQIFVSSEIRVIDRRVGQLTGSDHLPIILDFSIRQD